MIEQESELVRKLLEDIEQKILIDNHDVGGHGTLTKQQADRILQNGITGNISYGLFEMFIPLSHSDKTKADNSQAILSQVQNWPHKDAKYVVVVVIPSQLRKTQVTELFMDPEHKRERSRLPNRFIRGYVDVLNYKFVENSAFQENAAPTENVSVQAWPPEEEELPPPLPIPSASESGGDDVW